MGAPSYDSTILVTGGTTGLGYECAKVIAAQKPKSRVIISSRSSGGDAAASINKSTGHSNVEFKALDLSDLAGVRKFAESMTSGSYPPITALVLNAGIQVASGISYTKDGLETTFGVNHVGHALLFHLLSPHLGPGARVVITASGTHDPEQKTMMPEAVYESAELLAHPTPEHIQNNGGAQRYSTSKLCNILWTYSLERRRASEPQRLSWTVNAFDPGFMPGTGLARDNTAFLRFIWYQILPRITPLLRMMMGPNVHSTRESGQALARLAIGDDVQGVSGKYFEGVKEIKSGKLSYDEERQEELWGWTTKFVGRDEDEEARFAGLR